MTVGGKVVTGVATLGTIGGGGLLASNLLNKSITYADGTAGAKLIKEGFDLDVGNEWQTVLNAHNAVKNTENTFKSEANTNLELAKLQAECQSALNKKDDASYKKARQWCVKEKEIKDIFEKINLRGLDIVGASDDEGAWKTKETTLKSDNSNAQKLNTEMRDAGTTTVVNIKKACGIIVKLKTSNPDFNDKFELAKKWCAV